MCTLVPCFKLVYGKKNLKLTNHTDFFYKQFDLFLSLIPKIMQMNAKWNMFWIEKQKSNPMFSAPPSVYIAVVEQDQSSRPRVTSS